MKVLITGASGQLGRELQKYLKEINIRFMAYDSDDMNILNKEKINQRFKEDKPTVVFHCAAYTAVDKAEEEKEINWSVNVDGTRNVAEMCKRYNLPLIYISTDYIFDGQTNDEFKVDSKANPLNEYGKAKLAGEHIVEETLEEYYIIRTSWVYGEFGNNFVYTMKKLALSHNELTVISDQIGRPTWTRTLAEFMLYLVMTSQEYGCYHLSNDGTSSWYTFAKEILKEDNISIKPIESENYPQKAERPKHSVLDLSKTRATGFKIPHWKDALNEFMLNDKIL
ncbi:dTDP-4-dehydrorhamnose reductase [Alkalibacterium gilvum]|uniref:dTDP-4-dehydrorhamnose reductase n=1 Tax=Alkalibacterium gilvum TaxID=1130080 RepID=A0A1H6TAX1_9LACT|nr:dTDP-4-dehydrorhamnose reductase [Alkalibacterium gilvum]SEI77243.1 dTDP-4-dehydrorhamnose reductase [Alkalibacterium gilvum]